MSNATDMDSQLSYSSDLYERFREAARKASAWDVVHRPSDAGNFRSRLLDARQGLHRLEPQLGSLRPASPGLYCPPHLKALLELRANIRLLRTAVASVWERLKEIEQLPRAILARQQEEPRIATAVELYLDTAGGEYSTDTFQAFIQALQEYEPLRVRELWNCAGFLSFALLESLQEEARTLLHSPNAEATQLLTAQIKSLRTIADTDWVEVIEPLIVFDSTLKQDPAETYGAMDFESRDLYRRRVAFVAHYSDCSELRVAQTALDLARLEFGEARNDPRMHSRRSHVGYYLVGKGFPFLASRVGFHAPVADRMRAVIRSHADDYYITGIWLITVFVLAAVLFPLLPHSTGFLRLLLALIVVLLPATQDAVDLMNNSVTALFDPDPLPKLDFSQGIPAECATLVAIPSLLLNEEQVRKLVTDLEVRFLANRGPNLHFALLTDLPDSVSKPHQNDFHPLVALAIELIDELNVKYASTGDGAFLLLHRHRVFNRRQGVWMGWERKRGKLLDLNKLLAGEYDAFPVKAGKWEALQQVRYILTLDSDTQLPRGAAARLAGAMAHPLNQAVIDPRLHIVTDGYGILQPRVGVAVQSALRSRLASIYSGQTGFDIYTRAVSDAYQDLFGEGIFTGKGIYEVETLRAVLDRRFPRNFLLSHDLIEGAYARAGLATDVELIDDYPSHYSAYSRRRHRWMRGDWQIAQWIFSSVPDEDGRRVPNPITTISRWKVFDNLRRSLVDAAFLVLFLAGWFVLTGGPLYWTAVALILLLFPTVVQLGFALGRAHAKGRKGGVRDALSGFGRTALVSLLNLVFLPHQTILALDAILRALIRRFVTGERLLEWETAAQVESKSAGSTHLDRYLAWMPIPALGLAALVYFFAPNREAIFCAAPVLALWALACLIAAWLNKAPRERQRLQSADTAFLASHALRIWRYFHQFGGESHNFLIPDNVEEEGLCEAARVSPTNLGMLLNARQAACELGFLTLPEFVTLTQNSLATVAQMEKHRGHLYNWYDTRTLRPLGNPPFVSSVDSGNFVASLYTLHAGALDFVRRPLLRGQLFDALRGHWEMMEAEAQLPSSLAELSLPGASAAEAEWIEWLPAAAAAFSEMPASMLPRDTWWFTETARRIEAVLSLLRTCMPWMLPEFAPLRALPQLAFDKQNNSLSVAATPGYVETLDNRLIRLAAATAGDAAIGALAEQLHALLLQAQQNLCALIADLHAVAQGAERFANETEFAFLADPDRRILSIGYDPSAGTLQKACYDMLASEARIATFLAVARGDLPQQSWFKLSREFVFAFGRFVPLSWSGTMFEYLMPSLWMRSHPETLLARAQTACVQIQQKFGSSLRIPWGISESGSSRKNEDGHYHYHAYGLPQVSLWMEADPGPVISPYSTFLALSIDPRGALRNLRRMAKAGWIGAFGFYEAADFTASRDDGVLVREWMAHHQGMSLLAIVNLLCGNVVQRWFHRNSLVQSAELMLHEMPPNRAVLRARQKDLAPVSVRN